MISFHTPYDPFAPYVEGIVKVPVTPLLDVVEVQGSYLATKLANEYGNNDSFNKIIFNDPVSQVANSKNDGIEGLFPMIGDAGPYDSSPWDFWAPTNVNNAAGLQTNSTMTPKR